MSQQQHPPHRGRLLDPAMAVGSGPRVMVMVEPNPKSKRNPKPVPEPKRDVVMAVGLASRVQR